MEKLAVEFWLLLMVKVKLGLFLSPAIGLNFSTWDETLDKKRQCRKIIFSMAQQLSVTALDLMSSVAWASIQEHYVGFGSKTFPPHARWQIGYLCCIRLFSTKYIDKLKSAKTPTRVIDQKISISLICFVTATHSIGWQVETVNSCAQFLEKGTIHWSIYVKNFYLFSSFH